MEFHLSAEVAWGLLPQVDGATEETEDLDEFCDHFGEHPKTAGRTFTGGPDFFLKKIERQKGCLVNRISHSGSCREANTK
jgi:hypothetical protein